MYMQPVQKGSRRDKCVRCMGLANSLYQEHLVAAVHH